MQRESTETKPRMREVQISHSPVGSSLLAIPAKVPEAPECAIWDIPAQLGPKRTAALVDITRCLTEPSQSMEL